MANTSPTFVGHCEKMYNALNDVATDKDIGEGKTARVFVGRYSDVWASCSIAQTYYSPVRKTLERVGAIQILQKGGRNIDTVIALLGLPNDWSTVEGWKGDGDLTKRVDYARLSSRVEEIGQLVGGINLPNALIEIERRLEALEKAIASET